ncbi:hypothetical protein NEOLI_005313 [Neolecta irregularis DAH-3]|uniref:Uncharacterized protein n=1 Tax=Neolecta irregularis (strain DAH-3) TaxID=1198029 RepID=A0A1U7LL08_NEOID|nr:hypothetical protein NEOLI_005313 [Neolecta irregularis DAH-3]|eukprot:OLL23334.1 hypothetical protein NEOLI_005313 [Neolecta irregularis DAH-3]
MMQFLKIQVEGFAIGKHGDLDTIQDLLSRKKLDRESALNKKRALKQAKMERQIRGMEKFLEREEQVWSICECHDYARTGNLSAGWEIYVCVRCGIEVEMMDI